MSAHQKLSVQHHLASILNLSPTDDDDYISEILDQLLSIENAEDVAEYLGNFVADESAGDVAMFVEELGRFKSGTIAASTASVAAVNPDEQGEKVQAPSSGNRILDEGAAQREEIRLRELEAREKQRMEQERLRMKKEEGTRRQKEAESRNTTRSLQSKWEMKVESNAANNNANQTVPQKQKDAVKQPPKKKAVEQTAAAKKVDTIPSKPLKGTPKTICGCFGNKHAPLTNCLHCGRISCEREGYDYCPFCNHLITQFTPSSNNKYDSALAHKERLLEYDRTSASRTHVHDDQEDYFVTQSSMWSSAQEQEEASALEEERRKKLHHRGNQVLDITF